MLWHRQAIFESKGDKLSSSAESRILYMREMPDFTYIKDHDVMYVISLTHFRNDNDPTFIKLGAGLINIQQEEIQQSN